MIAAGLAAGAAWALIPGLLRAYLSTNEIITSLMLNYVAGLILTYLIFDSHSYWRDTTSASAAVFPVGQGAARRGELADVRLERRRPVRLPPRRSSPRSLLWVLYSRTRFGFEVAGDRATRRGPPATPACARGARSSP